MNTTILHAATRALYSQYGKKWQDGSAVTWPDTPDPKVSKIVIGIPFKVGDEPNTITDFPGIPSNFATLYPNLTHLHLWQIDNLTSLPELPLTLKCLDIRACSKLQSVCRIPSTVDTLVLEHCPQLVIAADFELDQPQELEDLSLAGSPSVDQSWIRRVVEQAPSLKRLDLSSCVQMERITSWPANLVDIRLNHCPSLKLILGWPAQLRRIELRGTTSLKKTPDFPPTIDYVDLAWTRGLEALPQQRQSPRTLFLYGSGVLEPPSSEHGKHDKENVAADVADYFQDVELTGKGEVRRCKLLILGNGDAGKTCLAMNLAQKDYKSAKADAEAKGGSISTHGVQFWDLKNFQANVKSNPVAVPLHLWDFGGQEIYHNTHRLFMSKGTVFVVVWNPEQDKQGFRGPTHDNGYKDEIRPLQYWLDLINRSCDHTPRIAIVCSRHAKPTAELDTQWRSQVRSEFHDACKCFYIDSWDQIGQKQDLLDWLQDEVGGVIATQGTAVPKYWEIAQEMVESWVQRIEREPEFARQFNSLTTEEFRQQLDRQIVDVIRRDSIRFQQLASACQSGEFELTPNRVRRTLNFLTRSGWLYWDTELFEGRVIVGQQWALDGLYTVLERRKGTEIFDKLRNSDGRFTQSDLNEWVWGSRFTTDEQKLLISFMERCGLCFRIRESQYAWREEDLYVSFEHLPIAKELHLQNELEYSRTDFDIHDDSLKRDFLHKYDWQLFLIDAGKQYGPNAAYAEDAILFRTEKDQAVLITCSIRRKEGFGGKIMVQVVGEDSADLLKELVAELNQRFPDAHVPGRQRSVPPETVKQVKERPSVFISYAWNSAQNPDTQYEAPADAIEALLLSHNFEIEVSRAADTGDPRQSHSGILRRDKKSISRGESLIEFMKRGARSTKVFLIHSDRYWQSINCLFELYELQFECFRNNRKSFAETVIPIEHPTSKIRDGKQLQSYVDFWKPEKTSVPSRMTSVGWWPEDVACEHAKVLIRNFGKELSDAGDLNLKWSEPPDKVLEVIRQRLELPAHADQEKPNE
jgi:GTPase SAR1 family protein